MGNITIWLTPVWVLAAGITAGLAALVIAWGITWLISRATAATILRLVRESILLWISYLAIVFVGFFLLAIPVMPARTVWHSLERLPKVGATSTTVKIPPRKDDVAVAVDFDSDELQKYTFTSEQDLVVGVEPGKSYSDPLIRVEGSEPYVWTPTSKTQRKFNGPVTKLYVTNRSDAATDLHIETVTDVPVAEVKKIPLAAGSVVAVFLVYLLIHWLFPSVSNIALATSKEAVAQPLYVLSLVIGACLLLLYIIIPYNTFGEDVKMYKDSGLMTIMVLAFLVSIWTASVSVADEIEGRTALTLLSKPISRREFVIGKFLGIVWADLLMFILLGAWMLLMVSYKVVYDARETANPEPAWQLCATEMMGTVPGMVLSFLETVVMTAISVAISTRLPILPNLVICGTIYTLGHLGPLIVQSSYNQNEFVAFFGQLIALILPVLDHFNIQAAVAGGVRVPFDYLGWAALYCALYSTVAMLLALILFEDRDLA